MRDIIWTLIVIWLIYKVVDIFKASSQKKSNSTYNSSEKTNLHNQNPAEKDIKEALNKHLNKEGEYVDFEELK